MRHGPSETKNDAAEDCKPILKTLVAKGVVAEALAKSIGPPEETGFDKIKKRKIEQRKEPVASRSASPTRSARAILSEGYPVCTSGP